MPKDLIDRLHEQNERVIKMNLEELESEHRSVLGKLVE